MFLPRMKIILLFLKKMKLRFKKGLLRNDLCLEGLMVMEKSKVAYQLGTIILGTWKAEIR
jgi:hypothetical protein